MKTHKAMKPDTRCSGYIILSNTRCGMAVDECNRKHRWRDVECKNCRRSKPKGTK